MWMVVLRSQRTVTSSSGKWMTVKYPADQMSILCFLSTTLDGFCKQTVGFNWTKVIAPAIGTSAHFHFLKKKRRLEVTLTGFPVSSSNAKTD